MRAYARVRRWDQRGTVRDTDSNVIVNLDECRQYGLIPVSGGGCVGGAGKGVQIRFWSRSRGVDSIAVITGNLRRVRRTRRWKRLQMRLRAAFIAITRVCPLSPFPDAEQVAVPTGHRPAAVVAPYRCAGESIRAALDALPAAGGGV